MPLNEGGKGSVVAPAREAFQELTIPEMSYGVRRGKLADVLEQDACLEIGHDCGSRKDCRVFSIRAGRRSEMLNILAGISYV
jgi:hypothetical protein